MINCWRGVLVMLTSCVALGACEWRREVVGSVCSIRNAQRNELLRVEVPRNLVNYRYISMRRYEDDAVGVEAKWKIERWTDDDSSTFYEFHNWRYDGFLRAVPPPVWGLYFSRQSFIGSREHANLFRIEPAAFDGTLDVSVTTKLWGYAVMLEAEKPAIRTPVKLTDDPRRDGDRFKWRITCASR